VSGEGKTIKRGSKEVDKGRAETVEAKRGRQYLLSGSRSASGRHASMEKELVKEDKSETIGNLLSDKEMNLIDLSLLTKRQ